MRISDGSSDVCSSDLVGRVVAHKLRDDGHGVKLEIFVNSPYERFVTRNARFWNASGVDVTANASGFKRDTQSLASVVAGGIGFQPPSPDTAGAVGEENAHFTLFDESNAAMDPPAGGAMKLPMPFKPTKTGPPGGAAEESRGVVG